MNETNKLFILLALLIGAMYYWITRVSSSGMRIISMLILVLLSYFVGVMHNKLNESRARGGGSDSEPPLKGGLIGN